MKSAKIPPTPCPSPVGSSEEKQPVKPLEITTQLKAHHMFQTFKVPPTPPPSPARCSLLSVEIDAPMDESVQEQVEPVDTDTASKVEGPKFKERKKDDSPSIFLFSPAQIKDSKVREILRFFHIPTGKDSRTLNK